MESNSYETDDGDDTVYNDRTHEDDDDADGDDDDVDGDDDDNDDHVADGDNESDDDRTASLPSLEANEESDTSGASSSGRAGGRRGGATGGGAGGAAAAAASATNPSASGEEDGGDDDNDDDDDDDDDNNSSTGGMNNTGNSNADDNRLVISAVSDLKSLDGLRELGPDAVCWQLSSAKPGNGVEQIRAESLEAYWQSDGQTQPHWIQVHFARRVAISHVCLYLDYHLDESYTPKKISVDAGMTHQDLQQAIAEVELPEPSGWVILPLRSPPDPLDDYYYEDDPEASSLRSDHGRRRRHAADEHNLLLMSSSSSSAAAHMSSRLYNHKNIVRAHLIRIIIHAMHQNGRDTHVRQVRLYGPRLNHGASPFFVDHHSVHQDSINQAVLRDAPALSSAKAKKHRGNDSAASSDSNHRTAWDWNGMDSIHASRFTTIR